MPSLLMHVVSARMLLWVGRMLFVAVALWWPAIWRDPIYTPRQARMAGHELRLADGTIPKTDDERALAIFWAWEHRQLVETRWLIGPRLGLRSRNSAGLTQTIFALIAIWIIFGILVRQAEVVTPRSARLPERTRRGLSSLFSTPLWQLFQRSRQQH